MGVGLPPPGSEPDHNDEGNRGPRPSQLHTHFGLRGRLVEVETFKGASDSHHLCIHTPVDDAPERQLLLISMPHSDPSDLTSSGYSMRLPSESKDQILASALELIRNGEIEQLERLFISNFALPLLPLTPPQKKATETPELSAARFSARTFMGVGSPDTVIERPHGARILRWDSPTEEHAIVRIEGSEKPGSRALGLHISKELPSKYGHYAKLGIAKPQGGFDQLSRVLRRLASHSDELNLREILEPLEPFILQRAYFPQTSPTGQVAQSVLDLCQREQVIKGPATITRYPPEQLTFIDQVEHILKHREQLIVEFSEPHRAASVWKAMVLHISDQGSGAISLFAGSKRRPFACGQSEDRISGGISLEYDLADLSFALQAQWFSHLVQAFASSHQEFPGPIGEALSNELHAETSNGAPRLTRRGAQRFAIEQLHPVRSVSYFISQLQNAFSQQELPCVIIARSPISAVLRASNPQGDRIEFTVQPDGIDDVYLFPRNNTDPTALCIGYSFEHLYQLGPEFPHLAHNIAMLLRHPSSAPQPIPSKLQNGLSSAPIGALGCHNYLRSHGALNSSLRSSFDYVCIVPKHPAERLAYLDQSWQRIDNPVAQMIKEIWISHLPRG